MGRSNEYPAPKFLVVESLHDLSAQTLRTVPPLQQVRLGEKQSLPHAR